MRKSELFCSAQVIGSTGNLLFLINDLSNILQKPWVDPGEFVKSADRESGQQCVADEEDSIPRGVYELALDFFHIPSARVSARFTILTVRPEAESTNLKGSERFLQRFLKRSADGHRLADAFHLGGESRISLGKFFKSETRNLDHAIVNHRFKTGRSFAGDVVSDFVEGVSDG